MSDELRLLLVDGDTPVLQQGLADVFDDAPLASSDVVQPRDLFNALKDSEDLGIQRWGVIVPEEGGADLLQQIAPLLVIRARQQGTTIEEVRRYSFPRGCDPLKWIPRHLDPRDSKRPRYLLLLGDLDELPLELQRRLCDCGYFAGRLAFDAPKHYAAYAAKVVAWEQAGGAGPRSRVVMLTARSELEDAPDLGYRQLMRPAYEFASERIANKEVAFELEDRSPDPSVSLDDLVTVAREERPTVLWTMSHGAAGERADAGELCFGARPDYRRLTARMVENEVFLPGGVWFMFACYGAGTPVRSTYWPWLMRLQEGGRGVDIKTALKGLARTGRPFIAPVPRAALANPRGPLAVVGHVDIAYAVSFARFPGADDPIERFQRLPAALADRYAPSRIGVAFAHFRKLHEIDAAIHDMIHDLEGARHAGGPPPVGTTAYGRLWLHRQDLANFILLGDPAVRLPGT